ncbi:MAG: type II toxin-antitoxin system HicB family antitoxin [Candidatus Omnitrophica bacterium]|nr:type II toxin-antitoxin system HicB family antitoxin [Candidatus Omnitrophota bacterium]
MPMRIGFTLLIFKEGDVFVSFCPELSVASCGDSVDEARRQGQEAVRLFLAESKRMGTLEEILQEDGFVVRDSAKNEWDSPPLISTEHSEIAF